MEREERSDAERRRAEMIEETVLAPVGSALVSRDTEIVERDGWYQVITPSTKSTQGNEIVISRLAAADVDVVVHRTIDQYAAHDLPFRWWVGPLTEPADFAGALERRGFVGWPVRGMAVDPVTWSRTSHENVAIASLGAAEARSGAEGRRGVSIEQVTADNLAEYYACFVRGWDLSVPDAGTWIDDHRRALATGRFHFFLARMDGEPVGTAAMIVKRRCVYLVGGNVIASHQHRGVYRALLDERLTLAASLGSTLAVTQAREATSAPILEKLGFESLYTSYSYKWEP